LILIQVLLMVQSAFLFFAFGQDDFDDILGWLSIVQLGRLH